MKYLGLTIDDYLKLDIKQRREILTEVVKESIRLNKKLNAFINFSELKESDLNLDSSYSLIPYAIKDNISTKDILTTGGSSILSNYVPCFNATVINRLNKAGFVSVGKTNLDELALGGTGTTGYFGPSYNPYDLNRITGGSSGGSAASVASGLLPFALGSDTGDSVRKPASLVGIVGYKPTFGLISRYGLFPFANSLDTIGIFARNVLDTARVLEITAGKDALDPTSIKIDDYQFSANLNANLKGKKGVIIKEIYDSITNEEAKKSFDQLIKKLETLGCKIIFRSIDKKLLRALLPTYYIISCSEASINNSNLDGIKFGKRVNGLDITDSIVKTRTEGFGLSIKKRFLLGSYCLKKDNQELLYQKALKIKRLIVEQFNEVLNDSDFIINLASNDVAPNFDFKEKDILSDRYLILENYLCFANFNGSPSITIPLTLINNLPIGVNITSSVKSDAKLLSIASTIEKVIDINNQYKEVK